MGRNSWNVSIWNGSAFVSDGTIYRSNENMNIEVVGTQVKVTLANGDNAFFSPETKYVPQDLVFQWLEVYPSDSFITKIKNYVKNGSYLKITDHLGGIYYGKFMNLKRVWLKGVDDTFDLESTFQTMADA